MAQQPATILPGVVFLRVTLDPDCDMVKLERVDNGSSSTIGGAVFKHKDEELRKIVELTAETRCDSAHHLAVLSVNGYRNRNNEASKTALSKERISRHVTVLENILRSGRAYIYKAMYQGETVGIIALNYLIDPFPTIGPQPPMASTGEIPFPYPSDPKAVQSYLMCPEKQYELKRKLNFQFNTHIAHYGAGNLLGLNGFGVKKSFRHYNIGRTLVNLAVSRVPSGKAIILSAESQHALMYMKMGFGHSKLDEVHHTIHLKPEWAAQGDCMNFYMLVLEK
ncbi:hypothetical protein F4861DRAFT_551814 [Xylaria intraflava]|nr:hypothetical protein F4861DRAFT_551814 [Xylaria intraflava]